MKVPMLGEVIITKLYKRDGTFVNGSSGCLCKITKVARISLENSMGAVRCPYIYYFPNLHSGAYCANACRLYTNRVHSLTIQAHLLRGTKSSGQGEMCGKWIWPETKWPTENFSSWTQWIQPKDYYIVTLIQCTT